MSNERRLFEFSPAVKRQALERQGHHCASCGDSLVDLPSIAHHAGITAQEARATQLHDSPEYVRSVDNCAMVCTECHEQFQHDGGKFRTAVEDSSALPYMVDKDALRAKQLAMQQECARENAYARIPQEADLQQPSQAALNNQLAKREADDPSPPEHQQSV